MIHKDIKDFITEFKPISRRNDIILANTLGIHKSSRIATYHYPDDKTNNKIDSILMKRRFKSGIKISFKQKFKSQRKQKNIRENNIVKLQHRHNRKCN